MTTVRFARIAVLLAIAAGALALAGCSASVSTGGGISSEEVAEEAQAQLSKVSAERGGGSFPKVDCPDELEEEAGAKTTCFANYDGAKHPIKVEVTKVNGEKADLHFEADTLPKK